MSEYQILSNLPQDKLSMALKIVDLFLAPEDLEEFVPAALSTLNEMTDASASVIYLRDHRLPQERAFYHPVSAETMGAVEDLLPCLEKGYSQISKMGEEKVVLSLPLGVEASPFGDLLSRVNSMDQSIRELTVLPLKSEQRTLGFMGIFFGEGVSLGQELEQIVLWYGTKVSKALDNLLAQMEKDREMKYLNTYLTISSMLTNTIALEELLGYIIWSCTDALAAEAGSILLLTEDKSELEFYIVEGEKKEALLKFRFPADRGIAGWVVQNREPVIVEDVQSDPRFFSGVDQMSGFVTRSILAVPLIAGEEVIGAMEILNKLEGSFTTDDLHLMTTIAEEVSYAIKNAILFKYVVKSYCKRLQGYDSCKGCERPLGSWTPCARYREEGLGIDISLPSS